MLLNLTNLQMNIILHQENIRTTEKNHEYIEGYKILNLPRVEQIVGVGVKNILDYGSSFGDSTPFLV